MDDEATAIAAPTKGQVQALGCLVVYGRVWVSWDISRTELRELESLGLCKADHSLDSILSDVIAWDATDKLKALLEPFQRLIATHKKDKEFYDSRLARIHPYWRTTSHYEKPEGVDEDQQKAMVETVNLLAQHMEAIRAEIGTALAAVYWLRWLDERDAEPGA